MATDVTPKLFNEISQAGHFAGGAAVVLAVVVHGWPMWVGVLLVVVTAGVKEFWYDYKYESAEVRGSSFEDFGFYLAGACVAGIYSVMMGHT